MSMILYYSNFCDKCKTLLQHISKSSVKKDMHFICIDKRIKRENGATYIILENGQEILLPPTVNKVPALLLLNRGHKVLFGNDISKYIEPVHVVSQQAATKNNGVPLEFSFASSGCGVASDNYSYLDQESSELSAKGNGGLRQMHHYAAINYNDCIETPPDTYSADTIGNVSMEQLQQKRNNDIMNLTKR